MNREELKRNVMSVDNGLGDRYSSFSQIPMCLNIGHYKDPQNEIVIGLICNNRNPDAKLAITYSTIPNDPRAYVCQVVNHPSVESDKPAVLNEEEITNILVNKAEELMEEIKNDLAPLKSEFVNAAYEMYKIEWTRTHLTPEIELQALRSNLADYIDNLDSYEGAFAEFNDSANAENGYNGECYVSLESKEEFLDNEFRDVSFMHELLQDSFLIKYYDDLFAREFETPETELDM